jgi:uncharacterized protein with PIN domain
MFNTNNPDNITINNSIKKTFSFRIYAGLNDFLPIGIRQKTFTLAFKTPITVREVIESIGIPLSEVVLVLVNSEPADFTIRLQENDLISLYPAFENFDISAITTTKQGTLHYPRFILDAHLGKLAKYLRMLGFDTLYRNDYDDQHIINIAKEEERIILTRDKLLLKSKEVHYGYFVRSIEKHEQLREIVNKFNLSDKFSSFTRCMTCNAELIKKMKSEIFDKIDPETASIFNVFFYCPNCEKVFWKGSHFERMEKLILNLVKSYKPL